MDKNSFLYSFYEMTGLPVRMFLNDELVEDYGQAVISEEYDQELRRQFVDDSEGFSYQLTPELLLYGYICSSDEKEKRYIILGPLCAENDAHKTIIALSAAFHKPVSEELWNYCNHLKTCTIGEFFSLLTSLRWAFGQNYPLEKEPLYHLFSERLKTEKEEDSVPFSQWPYNKNVFAEMLFCVENGHLERLQEAIKYRSTLIPVPQYEGIPFIRTIQDMCIIALGLCSQAAIRGGMDFSAAISSSNHFVERIERARSAPEVEMLQQEIMEFYTKAVATIKRVSADSELVQKTVSYIQAHLAEKITVNAIAEQFHQNAAYLSHHFKEKAGISITDYIRQEKMMVAKQILKSSERSLIDIAQSLGYSSQQYFQSQFKKETGMTPGEYRKMKPDT